MKIKQAYDRETVDRVVKLLSNRPGVELTYRQILMKWHREGDNYLWNLINGGREEDGKEARNWHRLEKYYEGKWFVFKGRKGILVSRRDVRRWNLKGIDKGGNNVFVSFEEIEEILFLEGLEAQRIENQIRWDFGWLPNCRVGGGDGGWWYHGMVGDPE